ncbi:MAG: hypothetical protein ACREBP_05360 [Sphingomicrobium sp.]
MLAAGLIWSALPAAAADCTRTSTGMVPLTDLGAGTYQGFQGGLYPGGANTRPQAHTLAGRALASLTVPRNAAGLPDPSGGRSVLLTIGMSNTRQESASLVTMAATDPLRHPAVVVVNGAQGGQDAVRISDPAAAYWTFVDQQLSLAGTTPAQVQAVWLKEAIAGPRETFPADATRLQAELREIVEILHDRFSNLNLIYLSSRIYAGYATTTLNPEPYAYQSGYAVKWLIEDAIDAVLPLPWLSWGPYLWADGTNARESDSLVWKREDLARDGTHPSASGREKVAKLLLEFFKTDPLAKPWFVQAKK